MFGSSSNHNSAPGGQQPSSQKSTARRLAIRENRPDTSAQWWERQRCAGTFPSVVVAAVFWLLASGVLMGREGVLPYRPNQSLRQNVFSRVEFQFPDENAREDRRKAAADATARVYRPVSADRPAWQPLREYLLALPDQVGELTFDQLPGRLRTLLDQASLSALQRARSKAGRKAWADTVNEYVNAVARIPVIPADQRQKDVDGGKATVTLEPDDRSVPIFGTLPCPSPPEQEAWSTLSPLLGGFSLSLQSRVFRLTADALRPTYEYDADATTYAKQVAALAVPESEWRKTVRRDDVIAHANPGFPITAREWQLLRAENRAYLTGLGADVWLQRLGVVGVVLLLTISLAAYTAHYQPKVVRNQARGVAMAALLLSMLVLAELAGRGTGPAVYWLAVAPTLLVGMILSIAYEQRFAVGVAGMHAMLVTVGLNQPVGFLLIVWVGVICTCFLLTEVRSRSKLIEVGGVAAVAMMAITAALGLMNLDPWNLIANNALYAGAAGLSVGFVTLGILPFVEKSFRITTGMTLLELADPGSNALLRRLQLEAPGTHTHSLQVATLAEAAAEAIGADSLLCRVASYYHDIGKMNKADYFVENQAGGQRSRHLNLTPSVSFLIIKGHVADGVEMAREYNLPHSVLPFVQQHHGTTLVEYFYHQACQQQQAQGGDEGDVSDTEFRYPGPKPRSKEVGILMLADAAESATRAEKNPTAAKIEWLVHELAMKRLLDGQFDDCDLTLGDLSKIEKSLTKTLLSLYHGRLAYPSTTTVTTAPPPSSPVAVAAPPMKLA